MVSRRLSVVVNLDLLVSRQVTRRLFGVILFVAGVRFVVRPLFGVRVSTQLIS